MKSTARWFAAHVSGTGSIVGVGGADGATDAHAAGTSLTQRVTHELGRALPRIGRGPASHQAAALACKHALESAQREWGAAFDVAALSTVVSMPYGSAPTDRAFWKTARVDGGATASPATFAATLPSAFGGELARAFGLRGPMLVIAEELSDAMPVLIDPRGDPSNHEWLLVSVGGPEREGHALSSAWCGRGPFTTEAFAPRGARAS